MAFSPLTTKTWSKKHQGEHEAAEALYLLSKRLLTLSSGVPSLENSLEVRQLFVRNFTRIFQRQPRLKKKNEELSKLNILDLIEILQR